MPRAAVFFFLLPLLSSAQTPRDVRLAAKDGQSAIPTVAGYLNSAAVDTRIEAVKQLTALGGKDSIDPLIRATHDADPEVQIRATDGLVNYYLPGYVKTGLGSSLVRAGASIKDKFSDNNDQIIDPFIIVRPEVISALGQLARGGSSFDSRANACRALGILRGRAALPDLVEALRSKDNNIMYESLAAIEKIGDPSAGPKIIFLLRDLDDRVQSTAIETAGTLRATDALPTLRSIVASPRNSRAQRSALMAIAMMPQPQDRDLFLRQLGSKDDKLRAAAAEGLGRIGDQTDVPALERIWGDEDRISPRLATAFALVTDGNLKLTPDSPLRYLINTLNSGGYHDVAYAYLVEAARRQPVLHVLYTQLDPGTKEEKIYLGRVIAASGDQGSVSFLDKLSRDNDQDVAREGLRSLRSLRARLGI